MIDYLGTIFSNKEGEKNLEDLNETVKDLISRWLHYIELNYSMESESFKEEMKDFLRRWEKKNERILSDWLYGRDRVH
jgi:hypothetical protein